MNKPHDVPEAKKKIKKTRTSTYSEHKTMSHSDDLRLKEPRHPGKQKRKRKKSATFIVSRVRRKNKIQTVFSSVSSTRCFQREATTAKRSRAFFVRALWNTPAPRVEEEGSVGRRTIDVAEGRDGKGKRKYQCSRWPARWVPNSFQDCSALPSIIPKTTTTKKRNYS